MLSCFAISFLIHRHLITTIQIYSCFCCAPINQLCIRVFTSIWFIRGHADCNAVPFKRCRWPPTGELSETQKQEMEHYKAKIKQQESEVTSLQQQMAKLSDIIDRQTAEIKGLNVEARWALYQDLSAFNFWFPKEQ